MRCLALCLLFVCLAFGATDCKKAAETVHSCIGDSQDSDFWDADFDVDALCQCWEDYPDECMPEHFQESDCSLDDTCVVLWNCERDSHQCVENSIAGAFFDWGECDCTHSAARCMMQDECVAEGFGLEIKGIASGDCFDSYEFATTFIDNIWAQLSTYAESQGEDAGISWDADSTDGENLFFRATGDDLTKNAVSVFFDDLIDFINDLIVKDCNANFCKDLKASYFNLKLSSSTKRDLTTYSATVDFDLPELSSANSAVVSLVAVVSALALFFC
eukprot:TRINITY_DN597_c0_g1_i3.p1 TRINITY_DN597_c0_g1~~TRINITY_DN597_c0_g1_i3.p1  ORF type:complete len:274 (-),score=39.52 TRINITY_DN597_c0_g1_i3:50-871(-)